MRSKPPGERLATTAWSMLVFIQQLEPLVWHGYQTYGVGVLQRVLDVWEDNQSTSNEEFWQSFFDEYPFIVSQVLAFPVVVVENKAYVGGKGNSAIQAPPQNRGRPAPPGEATSNAYTDANVVTHGCHC